MFPTLTDFADFIEQESLTVLNITPAYWHEWARSQNNLGNAYSERIRGERASLNTTSSRDAC